MDTREHALPREGEPTVGTLTRILSVRDLTLPGVVQETLCRAFEWIARMLMDRGEEVRSSKKEKA